MHPSYAAPPGQGRRGRVNPAEDQEWKKNAISSSSLSHCRYRQVCESESEGRKKNLPSALLLLVPTAVGLRQGETVREGEGGQSGARERGRECASERKRERVRRGGP